MVTIQAARPQAVGVSRADCPKIWIWEQGGLTASVLTDARVALGAQRMGLVVAPGLSGDPLSFPWSWLCGASYTEALTLNYLQSEARAEGKLWGHLGRLLGSEPQTSIPGPPSLSPAPETGVDPTRWGGGLQTCFFRCSWPQQGHVSGVPHVHLGTHSWWSTCSLPKCLGCPGQCGALFWFRISEWPGAFIARFQAPGLSSGAS